MRTTSSALCVVGCGVFACLLTVEVALAQAASGAEVSGAMSQAVSDRVRDMPGRLGAQGIEQKREKPLRLINSPPGQEQPDTVVQTNAGPLVNTTVPIGFPGVGNGDFGFTPDAAPPDTNLAVGATQIVQWVNESFAVFDKSTGALMKGPVAGNTLFANLGGGCANNNDGDPIAQYDKLANRWVLTQFSVATTPFLQCVAVSRTSDATGAYNLYAFNYANQFPDYPKLGVWPSAYFISFNIFNNGSKFAGAKVCAYDRTAMLNGAPATQQCFQLSTSFAGLLPGDVDSAASPPVAGTPAPFINFGSNSLNIWRFAVNWSNPANTTFTGPTNVPVAAFTPACNGGGTCIPQPGTSIQLDSLADRLMYRFAYRTSTAARAAESAVVNHSVKVSGNRRNQVTGLRWYQLGNLTSGTPTVLQQGTFSPDGTSRWMGSIAQDKVGDIALGYSASSGSLSPSIFYTGRVPGDPLGTLEAEGLLKAGGGSQTGNLSRWGDYSSMALDPTNECTFYYTTEYLKSSGSFNWSTWISFFSFPNCH